MLFYRLKYLWIKLYSPTYKAMEGQDLDGNSLIPTEFLRHSSVQQSLYFIAL